MILRKRAVFLDRDGTILKEKHYLKRPQDVELEEGAAEGLARLQKAGYALVVISNQSGIGRGWMTVEMLNLVNAAMVRLLEAAGVRLNGIFTCTHAPADHCECRKPSPELVYEALWHLHLTLEQSYFIGDKVEDIQTGVNADVTPILVLTGYGKESNTKVPKGFMRAANLLDAALTITGPSRS